MKRYLLSKLGLFLVLYTNSAVYSQTPRIDDLRGKLDRATDWKARTLYIDTLVDELWDYDFEEARTLAEKALELSKNNQFQQGQLKSLTDLGMYHYFKGDYATSKRYYDQALAVCGNCDFGRYPSYTFTRLGNLYRVQAKYDSARVYYAMAIALVSGKQFPIASSSAHYNLGLLYYDLAEYDSAEQNILRAQHIRESTGDSLLIAECWRSLAIIYKTRAQYAKAEDYYVKVNDLAKRYNDPELLMFYDIYEGELKFLRGDYSSAINLFSEALEMLKKHDFRRYHAIALQQIGRVFDAQNAYQSAVEQLIDAIKIFNELGDSHEIAQTNGMLGWIYIRQHNYELAEQYAQLGLDEMKRLGDRHGIAFIVNLLGFIHYEQKQYDQSLAYFQQALDTRRSLGLKVEEVNTLFNIAKVYEAQGALKMALEYHLQVLQVDEQVGNKPETAADCNAVAALLLKLHDYPGARSYLEKSSSIDNADPKLSTRLENLKIRARLASETGDHRSANRYYQMSFQVSDSLNALQNASRVLQLNALYQLDEKENEIAELNIANQLKENQLRLQEGQLRFQNLLIVSASVGLVLVSIVAFVIYQYYRSQSKAHVALQRLNESISEQKEEIMAQSEELIEANQELTELNRQIHEQKEEIQAQAEELIEANETISEANVGLEKSIEKRTKELKQAYQELDTFFYRSSHDFRRPITTFLGLAEVAKITVKDESALELFTKVQETATHLDKMLFKLQSISDLGGQQMVFKEVFLKELVEEIFAENQMELQKHEIATLLDVKVNNPFFSYPALVKTIIENLIENSIRFCGVEAPFIKVSILELSGQIQIQVEDNGQGIAEEYQARVFDMYYRANERSRGSGLGLYIVKKGVEKLLGTITFKSKVHAGSLFIIRLPSNKVQS